MDSSSDRRPILIVVEDDAVIRQAIARVLAGEFEVLLTEDAVAGKRLLDQNPGVAIVLADQNLPGESGLEFLAKVREQTPEAIRAVISGSIDPSVMANAINTSLLHRFILKPWDSAYFRIQMLEALASHDILRAKGAAEQLSITDALTGLRNHGYFQQRLISEVERAIRHALPLSIAMLDLDHFKRVNDEHGHPVGDQLLRAIAVKLLTQLRSVDMLARYGGEEFAIIMPDTPLADAIKVGERVRLACASNAFQLRAHGRVLTLNATISVGVSTLGKSLTGSSNQLAQQLVDAADAALYRAKNQGRNQTIGSSATST